jgi:hypothetical protein
MKERIWLATAAMILAYGLARAADVDVDPRTQCSQIMKGETESDRSWQPVYSPCCKSEEAMASRKAMERCIGNQMLRELQNRGVPVR